MRRIKRNFLWITNGGKLFSLVIVCVWKEFYRSEGLIKNESDQIAVLNVKMADAENDVENDGHEAQESDGEQNELENRSSGNINMEYWFLYDDFGLWGIRLMNSKALPAAFAGPLPAVQAPDKGIRKGYRSFIFIDITKPVVMQWTSHDVGTVLSYI